MSNPPKTDLHKHRRIIYPMPSAMFWRMGCTCGWEEQIPLELVPDLTSAQVKVKLDDWYVRHIPSEERQVYVLVDQRIREFGDEDEDDRPEGNWIMPEGIACKFDTHWESDGERFVHVIEPRDCILPVGEVRTRDGRIFRLE